jgi:hypothetical protein
MTQPFSQGETMIVKVNGKRAGAVDSLKLAGARELVGSKPAASLSWVWRRRTRALPRFRASVLVVAIVVVELCAPVGLVGVSLSKSHELQAPNFIHISIPYSDGTQGHLSMFTDYTVTFYCTNGKIILVAKGDPVLCSNGEGGDSMPTGTYELSITADTGYIFDGSVTTTGSVSYSSGEMTVDGTGTLTANFVACSSYPTVTPSTPQIQDGYRQAWVNWSYTTGSLTVANQAFSWSVGTTTLDNPAISSTGTDSDSINLNDLTAGTTYNYTVTASNNCGAASKSGSFSTASSMLTLDGSNVTSATGVTSLTADLTTNLSDDLIIAQVASSAGTGDVSSCSGAGLTFTQRAAYTPSNSPWTWEWYAEASKPLKSEAITCTYSVADDLGGLVVFGLANAYLASPYDQGSGDPCKGYGTTSVSCSVTTTSPNDMLLGLVASYHANGDPVKPGSGFTQIEQEDTGPYVMAEFAESGSSTGSYTISATKADGVGMALIGDAVRLSGFAGWISNLTTNHYENDQVGSPISGASIGPIWATCIASSGALVRLAFPSEVTSTGTIIPEPAAAASSSGYYVVHFPLTWASSTYTYYDLWQNGWCNDNSFPGNEGNESNSQITLNASAPNYWNATISVSSTFSVTNDYQQFGLLQDFGGNFPIGLALIHSTYEGVTYTDVGCNYTWQTSTTTSKISDDVVFGSETGQTVTAGSGLSWNVNGGSGVDDGLTLDFPVSGNINETQSGPGFVPDDTQIVGPNMGGVGTPYTTTDWLSNPEYLPSADPGAGWYLAVPPQGGSITLDLFAEGTYSSTTGYNVALSPSIGWEGLSLTGDISIRSTVTDTSSISNTLGCWVHDVTDPSGKGGLPYYWIDVNDSDMLSYSPVAHLWLEGFCDGTGEPSC